MLHCGRGATSGSRQCLTWVRSLTCVLIATTTAAAEPAQPEAAIAALASGDFTTIATAFGHDGPSAAQIAATWRTKTAHLGRVVRWTVTDRTPQDGFDTANVRIELEHGALGCLVSIDPDSHQLASLYLAPAAPPAPYVDRTRFREVPVTFGDAPFTLSATLTLPEGGGPFPAAVLVHGSGPNDRDETFGANKVFTDLAQGLASAGIAVLRYDKRTFTYGDRLTAAITIDDEVITDAVLAVHTLAARREVDPARVFVIGHSLGGMLAPEIAVRAGGIAGVALLAPPGRSPWQLLRAQLRYLHAPRETQIAIERAIVLSNIGMDDQPILGMPASYWRDWDTHNGIAIAMAKQLGRPILVLQGTRDYQVTRDDLAVWQHGLRGARFVVLPSDNHLMITGRGQPNPTEYKIPGHVDPRAIAALVALIREP